MMKKFTFSAFALGLCLSGFAQEPVNSAAVAKIRAEGLDKSKAYDIAYQITDVAGPRLSNSPGLKRAQDWAVKYFNDMGLKNVHLEAWGEFGKGWQVDKYYAATTAPLPIVTPPNITHCAPIQTSFSITIFPFEVVSLSHFSLNKFCPMKYVVIFL